MSGRIVLLLSSPRVAPGLLGWPAWELLTSPDSRVYAADASHPQLPALRAANVEVRPLADEPDQHATDPDGVADLLYAEAAAGAVVVWMSAPGGDPELGEALENRLMDGRTDAAAESTEGPELELLPGSYDLPGARLIDLVQVMDRLRRECPWVQQQTHRSLVRYLVEEAYETVEALEADDRTHLREELGDLLFQVVFHARLAEESTASTDHPEHPESWSIDEVAADLTEKLVRRNPHVFGPQGADHPTAGLAPDEIENVWDQLKSEEKQRASVLDGVPSGLPALALADKLLERVRKAGSRLPELPASPEPGSPGTTATTLDEERVGRTLLSVVSDAHAAGIDPEQALRDAIRRFARQVRTAEQAERSGADSGEDDPGRSGL